MKDLPVHILVYHSLNRDKLVAWRKEVILARQNWQIAIDATRKIDFIWLRRRHDIIAFKAEAALCLKHERACTQIIEYIDGKRAGLGVLTGDKDGGLLFRVPFELTSAFNFCLQLAY